MTLALHREFLTNPDHGLDCYLSMRIRHGTLAGQLRTPLEVGHLITQRLASSDEYTSNQFWTEMLNQQGVAPEPLDERLARFSRDYDDLITEMSSEMIQIRSPDRPAGLFDTRLLSAQLLILSAEIGPDLGFEEFLDRCFDMCWENVDFCLKKVREVCRVELKPRITQLFNSLDADVALLAGAARVDLEQAIRAASTGANQSLDIVADWFRLPAPIEMEVFPIEAMIDVGLQCVTTIYPEFHPQLRTIVPPGLPQFGDALAFFSDAFFIVFDNIRRHSGVADPDVDLVVEMDPPSPLRIRIQSKVSDNVDISAIEARLALIRERIETDDYRSAVTSEGGTGLIKLHRILRGRNKENKMLNFRLENRCFLVEFEVLWREAAL